MRLRHVVRASPCPLAAALDEAVYVPMDLIAANYKHHSYIVSLNK